MAVAAPAPPRLRDPSSTDLGEGQAGERLSREDGLALFATDDLHGVGRRPTSSSPGCMATRSSSCSTVHQSDQLCVLSCSFCDFARKKGEDGAFENTIEDVLNMIKPGTREAHIVGGHHRTGPSSIRAIDRVHPQCPAETQIKAFTAAEIDYFWRRWKIEPREALTRLQKAGLQSMPGGGAEIFSRRLQKLLHFTGKADADRWCEIHGIAHSLGIKTNATMLYGHVETMEERVDHLLRLREQQDKSGGFITFIPLSYQTGTTKLVPRQTPPTDDLRTIAASRLLLDNFPHIEAYWVMIGEATASLALHFGASDVNGTLEDEKIAHMAQAASPAGLATEQILRIVRDAGKIPVERDALYNVVKVWS